MLKATYKKYDLQFIRPGGTSRGVLKEKETWFIFLADDAAPDKIAIGECGLFRGLSADDRPEFEDQLKEVCSRINEYSYWLEEGLKEWPAIQFGLETAIFDLLKGANRMLFPSAFTEGNKAIPINGLIWMGDRDFMVEQIQDKLTKGFRCIKMKIGAIDFKTELELLWEIRKDFGPDEIQLRVDANGAFSPLDAMEKLQKLAELEVHSIEQPLKPQYEELMAELCSKSPVPIALDEQLIGVFDAEEKQAILDRIKPQYIILKPSLVGGIKGCYEWIEAAKKVNAGWWMTSALESNIGLNAIAQFTYSTSSKMFQGLGTGQLFSNNIESPLAIQDGMLHYTKDGKWELQDLLKDVQFT